jgi:hypothetical protein
MNKFYSDFYKRAVNIKSYLDLDIFIKDVLIKDNSIIILFIDLFV